ncbi:MAG: hypothetical protein RLZZ597_2902 [Cyanobacteriota bacterium]|jgi:hypothetical protein
MDLIPEADWVDPNSQRSPEAISIAHGRRSVPWYLRPYEN